MIQYEKEICEHLRLPSIPKKEWNGKDSFRNCVAVVKMFGGGLSYAVSSFDAEKDKEPRIVRVFGQEQFNGIEKILIVPEYMNVDDIKDSDLDEESKKRAEALAKEAKEIENEGVEEETVEPENEYWFDHIHSDEEARAYIEAYNKANKLRARIPKTHEGLIMRLSVIYSETNKK